MHPFGLFSQFYNKHKGNSENHEMIKHVCICPLTFAYASWFGDLECCDDNRIRGGLPTASSPNQLQLHFKNFLYRWDNFPCGRRPPMRPQIGGAGPKTIKRCIFLKRDMLLLKKKSPCRECPTATSELGIASSHSQSSSFICVSFYIKVTIELLSFP